VAVAVGALVIGAVGQAVANTELVPASRLLVPFFDISSGRDTFLILVNASRNVRLDGTTFSCAAGGTGVCGPFGVHLEFYGQTCQVINTSTFLTPGDIDQFDLATNPVIAGASTTGGPLGPTTASGAQSGLGGRGWVDIDARFTQAAIVQRSDPSIQANVLIGTVVITDSPNDFALAYPMASGIGTSRYGILGRIVRRSADGRASAWSGRYEPFPPRTFVPVFFAEGTDTQGANAGTAFTAFLAAAGPADGNWDNSDDGEAPGQSVFNQAPLLQLQATIFDGCEHSISSQVSTHYLNNFLSKIFPAIPARTNWLASNCVAGEVGTTGAFPGRDILSQQFDLTPGAGEARGQALGWIDMVNTALSCDLTTPGTGATNCPSYTAASTSTASSTGGSPGTGVGQRRGVVGVIIENVVNTTIPLHLGDVTRLWGDCTPWEGRQGSPGTVFDFPEAALCEPNTQTLFRCTCSLVDLVEHQDIAAQGNVAAFVASPGLLP
jgi:hypothetical protein